LAYGGGDGIAEDDGQIQMIFDTGFDDDKDVRPPMPSSSSTTTAPGSAARPELIKSAQTMPNLTLADPWADTRGNYDYDDDDDFGKEKEISMTFA
jgi:hypothetical protein